MRILILILFVLISPKVWATTWYVRDGGGTSAQCTGKINAVYPGSGTGQNCAYIHPRYVMGWGCGGSGTSTCAGSGSQLSSGDTVFIDGDSDIHSGQQAQYEIGYDDTGSGLTPGCSTSFPYDCTTANIVGGSSSSARTSIIGTGTHKPQLWGTQRVWSVLNAINDHIALQWLEITDHSACGYVNPVATCNYGGPYPYGPWAEDGVELGGNDEILTDVYIHGVGRYGVNVPDYISSYGSITYTRVYSIGNGYGGVTTGINAAITGTSTWNQPVIEWNGCVEAYPVSSIDAPSNYSNCFGQNSGGYGDGLAFGASASGLSAGNWTITGPGSISFNTQDGLDTLHGAGTGTIQVDKMRFEGNAGDQVKMNALNSYLTNSLVVGNCGWWYQSSQAASGAMQPGDACRALGDTILFNVTNGSTTRIYNNTIIGNGNVTLESEDLGHTGCNGSTAIYAANNIINGGYVWIDDTTWNGAGGNAQTTYLYNDGNDGNGGGTCGNLVWNEDYNIVNGTKGGNSGCVGAHDQCGTASGFSAGTFPVGTSGGGRTTYYTGQSGITLLPLGSGSAAVGSGENGLTYWNNENDFSNVTRTSPPAKGGLELNSCAVGNYFCQFNSSCCGNSCTNNSCGTCTANGGSCSSGSTCCSLLCSLSVCVACVANGNSCVLNSDCCSGICSGSVCSAPPIITVPACFISGNSKISGNSNF